jgi:hypothetical protein
LGCCIFAVAASFFPRLALLVMWLFTDVVTTAFERSIWPLLGVVILPVTTIVFSVTHHAAGGVAGIGWLWVALGLAMDVLLFSGGGYMARAQSID